MAAPTITHDGAVITTCDSITGFSGGSVDSELFKQGSASVGGKAGSGITAFVYTGSAINFVTTAAGEHVIIWLTSLTPGKLDTLANGGLRLRVGTSASVYGDYYLAGIDSYKPVGDSFIPYAVDMARDFDSTGGGMSATAPPLTNATTFGGATNCASGIMGNFNNFLLDQISRGFGLILTGGDATNSGTVESLRTESETQSYGWFVSVPGGTGAQAPLQFGSAATAAYVRSDSETVTFLDRPVSATFYELVIRNAGSDVDMSNGTIQAASTSTPWGVRVLDGATFTGTGQSFLGATAGLLLNTNTNLTRPRIVGSGQITQNGATLTDALIESCPDPVALVATDTTKLEGTTFSGNVTALKIQGPGPHDVSNITFTGNTTDIEVDDPGDVVVNMLNGSNATTATNVGAGTVQIVTPQVSIQITDIPAGLEARFRQGSFTLLYFDNVQTGSVSYSYSFVAERPLTVSIGGVADDGTPYERREIELTLKPDNQSIPFALFPNPSYLN